MNGKHRTHEAPMRALHPAARLATFIVLVVSAVAVPSAGALVVPLAFALLAPAIAGVPAGKPFAVLARALPVLLFVLLIQAFLIPANDAGEILLRIRFAVLTSGDLVAVTRSFLRFAILILLFGVFLRSHGTREIVNGFEELLRPLSRLGLPAHEIVLTIGITIRFVPVLRDETDRILTAQRSRGAVLPGRGKGFVGKMRSVLPILVPILLASLRHAERLATAMEARCYSGGTGRTRLRDNRAKPSEAIVPGAVVAAVLIASFTIAPEIDRAIEHLFGL